MSNRPDREKIAYWFYEREARTEGMKSWHKWEEISPEVQAHYLKIADQILALFPDVKHDMVRCPNCGAAYAIIYDNMAKRAKREERKRITAWGIEVCPHWASKHTKGVGVIKRDCSLCWQALNEQSNSELS